jgi:LysM repeat protein
LPNGENGLPDNFLVYLDVWERHITAIEDPDIREVALGGPDTAARARVVWQVKITDEMPDGSDITDEITKDTVEHCWNQWVKKWQPTNRGKLKAKAKEDSDKDIEPCIISPEARYRGVENQLYRVEIHRSGAATQQEATGYEQQDGTNEGVATFKWARDNGSVVFPILDLADSVVTLEHLGRDSRLSLKVGDRVEIVDDEYALQGRAEPLLRVEAIDPIDMRVTLSGKPLAGGDPAKHPLLRRWDHGAGDSEKGELETATGTLLVEEGAWLELEDGVQIYFQPPIKQYTIQYGDTLSGIAWCFGTTVEELQRLNDISDPNVIYAGDVLEVPVYHKYRTGDYWLIPARTATGDVEWPGEVGQPEARPPHGIEHHYAPLAIVISAGDNGVIDCRRKFEPNVSLDLRLDTGSAEWMVTQDPDSGTVEPRPANIIAKHQAWTILPGTQWIGPSDQAASDAPTGLYRYRFCFCLCSGFRNAKLEFDVLADNRLTQVWLNTSSVDVTPVPSNQHPFQVSTHVETADQSMFIPGENCITLEVQNDGGPSGVDIAGGVTVARRGCACP